MCQVHTDAYVPLEKPTIPLATQEKLPRIFYTWYLSLRIRTSDASRLEKRYKEKNRGERKGKERKGRKAKKERKEEKRQENQEKQEKTRQEEEAWKVREKKRHTINRRP